MCPDEQALRAAIVAEAHTWLRTKYVHCANVKGAGVDCAMLLIEIGKACGIVPPDFDPRPYEPEWYLHRSEERYMAGLERFMRRLAPDERGQPGDVDLFRFGRTASHGGLIVSEDLMIHAYRPHGNVELHERRALADRYDSTWSFFQAVT
jgi:NlpC/P60 family putative phage cell wall peptidase